MDAFIALADPVPATIPEEQIPREGESSGPGSSTSGSSTGSCVIA